LTGVKTPFVLGAIVALVIVLAAIGGNNDKNNNSSGSTSSAPGPAAAAPQSAGVGQEVRDGKFAFTVTSVDTSPVAGDTSNQFERVQAQGKFVNVHITVKNTGDRPQTFSASNQKLHIGSNEFSSNDIAAVWTQSANVDINPGNSIPALISFDVPPGTSSGAVIELHDSAFSGGTKVLLQQSGS
jgi:Domain of unknown function (DUF4352)